MVKTLRPSVEAFKRAGWYPASQKIYDTYINELSAGIYKTMKEGDDELLPSIKAFKKFIHGNPTVLQEFIRMFEGISRTETPSDLDELLFLFNTIFRQAPFYGDLGPPLYMIMARIMNTQGGFSAFTKEILDIEFKKLFVTWATFLESPDSRYVLCDGKVPGSDKYYGWFSDEAKKALMAEYTPGRTFEQVFICEPSLPYHGYVSFDDFFNRRYRNVEIDRPVYSPSGAGSKDLNYVSAPCEATTYNLQYNVKREDPLFIKDEAYSIKQLLYDDPLMEKFVDGTVVQGFLNTTGYHRWHSPVNGRIIKIIAVQGSYFNQAPSTLGSIIPSADDDTTLPPYLRSLRYFSHTNTRALIFIEPDNSKVGTLCFVGIGMTEISTCAVTVYDNQHVNRGDELGMFHFGGSSFALVFTPESDVTIDSKYKPGYQIHINDVFASVN